MIAFPVKNSCLLVAEVDNKKTFTGNAAEAAAAAPPPALGNN